MIARLTGGSDLSSVLEVACAQINVAVSRQCVKGVLACLDLASDYHTVCDFRGCKKVGQLAIVTLQHAWKAVHERQASMATNAAAACACKSDCRAAACAEVGSKLIFLTAQWATVPEVPCLNACNLICMTLGPTYIGTTGQRSQPDSLKPINQSPHFSTRPHVTYDTEVVYSLMKCLCSHPCTGDRPEFHAATPHTEPLVHELAPCVQAHDKHLQKNPKVTAPYGAVRRDNSHACVLLLQQQTCRYTLGRQ